MKKRLISLFMAMTMALSVSAPVIAEEDDDNSAPTVKVNDRTITFADQEPVILQDEGRTMVPARGVFECMGAKVDWDGDKRLVTINSSNNVIRILITIDNPVMTVYTFTSVLSADKSEITLDAAPRIMNDRTMIPLRAISEALKADVEWDGDTRTISIFTSDYEPDNETEAPSTDKPTSTPKATAKPTSTPKATSKPGSTSKPTSTSKPGSTSKPTSTPDEDDNNSGSSSSGTSSSNKFDEKNVRLSLSADKTTANVGDIIEVSVNVSGIDGKLKDNEGILGVTTVFVYDKELLQYVDNSAEYNTTASVTKAENAEFASNKSATVGIFIDTSKAMRKDGKIETVKFKVLSDKPAEISLSKDYNSKNGYDTGLDFTIGDDEELITVDKDLKISSTPVKIN